MLLVSRDAKVSNRRFTDLQKNRTSVKLQKTAWNMGGAGRFEKKSEKINKEAASGDVNVNISDMTCMQSGIGGYFI